MRIRVCRGPDRGNQRRIGGGGGWQMDPEGVHSESSAGKIPGNEGIIKCQAHMFADPASSAGTLWDIEKRKKKRKSWKQLEKMAAVFRRGSCVRGRDKSRGTGASGDLSCSDKSFLPIIAFKTY